LAEVEALLSKMSWGQEVEIRIAPDRDKSGKPMTTLSAKSQQKADFTVARVAVVTKRPRFEQHQAQETQVAASPA